MSIIRSKAASQSRTLIGVKIPQQTFCSSLRLEKLPQGDLPKISIVYKLRTEANKCELLVNFVKCINVTIKSAYAEISSTSKEDLRNDHERIYFFI